MSEKFDTAHPYTAVFVIFREHNKVAFVLRGDLPWMADHYGLPSGKVEIAETFRLAAVREAKEEVGVDIDPKDLKYLLTMQRNSGSQEDGSILEWVDMYFEATKWNGELINAEPHMHRKLEWLDLKNLPENVIPPVKAALEMIEAGQTYGEYGWEE